MSMFNNSFSGSQIGGGFVSNKNDNYGNQSNTQRRQIPYEERKLSQLTIKQIMTAPPTQSSDEPVMIDEVEVSQLHMVVKLLSIDVQSSHVGYRINDYTGTLDAKQWSTDGQQPLGATLQPGSWVHIFGRINSFQGKFSVNVFDVVPVTNFNEVTHHFTEVVFAHLSNLEMAKKKEMQMNNMNDGSMMMGGNNNMNTNSMGPGFGNNQGMGKMGGMSAMSAHGMGGNGMGGGGWNNGNQQDSGRPAIQQMVLKVVKSPEFANSETGCNVNSIFQKLQGQDIQSIREAIDILAEEGAMYSTLDDEHYKAVE